MSTTYSISDLAKEFDVTTRTLRYYEEMGLLRPQRSGKTRCYSISDRTRLKLILRGKRLGLSLEESLQIIDMYDPEHGNFSQLQKMVEKIEWQKQKLSEQLKDIELMLRELDEAKEGCLKALKKVKK